MYESLTEISLMEKFLLLFKRSRYSHDFTSSHILTLRYKALRGKIYILEEIINPIQEDIEFVESISTACKYLGGKRDAR